MVVISYADGSVDEDEIECLVWLCNGLGVDPRFHSAGPEFSDARRGLASNRSETRILFTLSNFVQAQPAAVTKGDGHKGTARRSRNQIGGRLRRAVSLWPFLRRLMHTI